MKTLAELMYEQEEIDTQKCNQYFEDNCRKDECKN